MINMVLALVISILISLYYYARSLDILKALIEQLMGTALSNSMARVQIDFLFYLKSLWNEGLGSYFFVLLLLSTVLLAVTKAQKTRHLSMLVLWIFLPYLYLSILPVKICRYIMPLLPAIAIITGMILFPVKKHTRWLLFGLLTIAGLGQYLFLSYCPLARSMYPVMRDLIYRPQPPGNQVLMTDNVLHTGLYQAEPYDWEAPAVYQKIKECGGIPQVILAMSCPTQLKAGIMLEALLEENWLESFLDTAECDWTYTEELRDLINLEHPPDIIIAGDFPKYNERCRNDDYNMELLCENAHLYQVLERYHLLNGANISLLARRPAGCAPGAFTTDLMPEPAQSIFIDSGSSQDAFYYGGDACEMPALAENSIGSRDIPVSSFMTARCNNFEYFIRLPYGNYILELWFIDQLFPAEGRRIFDVYLNGHLFLDDFEINSQTEPGIPLRLVTKTAALGCSELQIAGYIHIVFRSKVESARVSAIMIRPDRGQKSDDLGPDADLSGK